MSCVYVDVGKNICRASLCIRICVCTSVSDGDCKATAYSVYAGPRVSMNDMDKYPYTDIYGLGDIFFCISLTENGHWEAPWKLEIFDKNRT